MIVYLITMGHVNDVLAVIRNMLLRCYDSIRDDVIKAIGTAGARESEIVDLNRRRAQRTDFQPVSGCMTHKINEYINLIIVDTFGRLCEAKIPQINKSIAILTYSLAVPASIVNTVRITIYFHSVSIMETKQTNAQVGDRMIAEIIRQIAYEHL